MFTTYKKQAKHVPLRQMFSSTYKKQAKHVPLRQMFSLALFIFYSDIAEGNLFF